MCDFITNTISSAIGGVIGAFVAGAIAYTLDRIYKTRIAKENLISVLVSARDYSLLDFPETEKRNYFNEFRASYPKVLAAYITYRNLLVPPYRTAVEDAWREYKGTTKKCFDGFESDFSAPIDVNNRDGFEIRIEKFLKRI